MSHLKPRSTCHWLYPRNEIEPVLDDIQPYRLDQDDRLVQDHASKPQASVLQANAKHRSGLVEDLAEQLNLKLDQSCACFDAGSQLRAFTVHDL